MLNKVTVCLIWNSIMLVWFHGEDHSVSFWFICLFWFIHLFIFILGSICHSSNVIKLCHETDLDFYQSRSDVLLVYSPFRWQWAFLRKLCCEVVSADLIKAYKLSFLFRHHHDHSNMVMKYADLNVAFTEMNAVISSSWCFCYMCSEWEPLRKKKRLNFLWTAWYIFTLFVLHEPIEYQNTFENSIVTK